MRPHAIMFHHFHDDRHPPGQGAITADELRQMILHLDPRRLLPAREWAERATTGCLRDDQLCLTFDDNLLCQYEVALPVLREFGLTAFWFAYTSVIEGNLEPLEVYRYFRTTQFDDVDSFYTAFFDCVTRSPWADEVATAVSAFNPVTYLAGFGFYSDSDRRFRFVRDDVLGPQRYVKLMDEMIAAHGIDPQRIAQRLWMTPDHLRALHGGGHVIGLHSHTHPTRLERMTVAEQHREYAINHAVLSRILGQAPQTMSHPCNSYNSDTLRLLRDMGIQLGFRANMAQVAGSELEHPREDHANVLRRMTLRQAA